MSNPDDDTDVPSGFNDDAEMERTPSRTFEKVEEGRRGGGMEERRRGGEGGSGGG